MTDDFDSFLDSILNMDTEEEALPSGGGFAPGFVGPVTAAVRWKFWSSGDLEEYDEHEAQYAGKYARRGREDSWFHYFEDRALAKMASDLLDAYAPGQCWRFEIPTSEVLNFAVDAASSGWGETIGAEVGIKTYRSKYRHEFHMIALPSAVNALALHMGWLEEPHFDLGVVVDADEGQFDDEFQARMIGGEGVKWRESELWEQRTRLWSALGEDNPEAYNPIGVGADFNTTSKRLSQLLGIVTRPWVKPVWGRLVLVPDPRHDATFTTGDGDTKRLSLAALTQVYGGKAAAVKAVEEEGAPVAESEKVEGRLIIPEAWAEYPKEWKAELAKVKEQHGGALPPKPKLIALASGDMACTVEDIIDWWGEV